MKKRRMSTRGLLILLTCMFLGCVFVLSAFAVYLDQTSTRPKEGAVSATVVFTTYLYGEECYEEIRINVDGEEGLADMREVESCVKNCTLKEYTNMVLWEAEFTYVKEDGSKEQRTYRKTGVSKDVDKFLDKYYGPPAEGSEGE